MTTCTEDGGVRNTGKARDPNGMAAELIWCHKH